MNQEDKFSTISFMNLGNYLDFNVFYFCICDCIFINMDI
jgi:hypothetical protein